MACLKRYNICNGVNFNYINCEKFKTGKISITFFLPLNEKTASANFVLSNMLKRQCAKYPGLLEIDKKLSELYGASLFSHVFKLGEIHGFTISLTGIENKYALNKEPIFENLASLLSELIFNPYLDENGLFSKEDLEDQKRELLEKIDAEFNNKRIFAKHRCEELMCKNEAFAVNRYGSKKEVENLSAQDIYSAWRRNLKNAKVEIMQIGSSDCSYAKDIFEKAFAKIDRTHIEECTTEIKQANGIHEYSDIMKLSQCKLVMGFRAKNYNIDSMCLKLMSAIFGGTPNSKLFLNVREKMSLCYYCSSQYNKDKSILLVQSGVEKENIEKAKTEILNQLSEMQSGNFSLEDIDAAKKSMINNLNEKNDSLSDIENFYISQVFDSKILSIHEATEKINNITKEQIVEAAQGVVLDTIYVLRGEA